MKTHWEFIAECLRQELAEYGGLLNLFEEQQRSLFERNVEAVVRLGTEIELQAGNLQRHRELREDAVSKFAERHGRPSDATLRSLLPLIDPSARPLLEALIDEVNHLLHRVRRTSRHNHTLISRAVEVHQEMLQHMRPQSFTKTYSPAGRLAMATAEASSTLRVAG